jgi:hypothetical protein
MNQAVRARCNITLNLHVVDGILNDVTNVLQDEQKDEQKDLSKSEIRLVVPYLIKDRSFRANKCNLFLFAKISVPSVNYHFAVLAQDLQHAEFLMRQLYDETPEIQAMTRDALVQFHDAPLDTPDETIKTNFLTTPLPVLIPNGWANGWSAFSVPWSTLSLPKKPSKCLTKKTWVKKSVSEVV